MNWFGIWGSILANGALLTAFLQATIPDFNQLDRRNIAPVSILGPFPLNETDAIAALHMSTRCNENPPDLQPARRIDGDGPIWTRSSAALEVRVVTACLQVNRNGRVEEVHFLDGPFKPFMRTRLAGVVAQELRFAPATLNGRAVRSWIILPVGFDYIWLTD